MKLHAICTLTLSLAVSSCPLFADSFVQTNLVSDIPGMANVTDPDLKNPWGMAFSATSPFWISNQGSANSTLYNGAGVKQALTVTVPPTSPPPTGPTGQVFAGLAGNFLLGGNPSSFIFSTLAGTIDAWNGGTTATVVATTTGAVYTGLALANNGTANFLYAANFVVGGGINVFDSSFAPTTLAGSFKDTALPDGYAPYNIAAVGGKLYVEYGEVNPATGRPVTGAGLGYVDVFDTNGNFLQRLISKGSLNVPWGIAVAPNGFGNLGGDLLVGNFGNGEVNAFDPTTGAFVETLSDTSGRPIVNSGLWELKFRTNGGSSSNPNALYFDAGINGEADGLFGYIQSTPEPSTWIMGALGILGIAASQFRRARR